MNRKAVESNKLVYIPVMLPSPGLYKKADDIDKSPLFWNSNGIWKYPNLLVSTYHAREFDNIRETFNIDDDVFILGDSGGFQVVSLGGKLSPEEVIKWQMKNCDAGLILDRPPYEFSGNAQFSGTPSREFFKKCLNITKENASVALKYNKGENKIRLYGVVQGETWNQIDEWYNEIHSLENDEEQFDAWALSPKPSNDVIKIAMFGILALEKKINKPLHILQVTGRGGILVAAYIRYLTKQLITIDSSSNTISARYGIMIDPMNIPATIGIGKNVQKRKGWMCGCPICQEIDIESKEDLNQYYPYLNIHNLYQFARYVKYCDYIVESEEERNKIAEGISPKCKTAIDMLTFYVKHGLTKTLNYYKQELMQTNASPQSVSLFNFHGG